MRVSLVSDSSVIGRTLSDLLALLQCEIASASPGTPELSYRKGTLQLTTAEGLAQPLIQPLTLRSLAQQLTNVSASARGAPLPLGMGWRLEPLARMLHHEKGQHVPLTEKECLLLTALRNALPDACSRETLLKDVWAYESDVETHTLETHIYRLRSKLEALTPQPCDIVTLEGTYRLTMAIA
jgi:DNA-binding response OmpR family regulator